MKDTREAKELEIKPQLPTSSQLLGTVARNLGVTVPGLNAATLRRYFSGRLEGRGKDSTRRRILEAIAEAISELRLGTARPSSQEDIPTPPSLAEILEWHALEWDRLRAFLLPRMSRVYPRHLAAVWVAYARLATIDLALRLAAHMHLTGAPPSSLDFLDWVALDRRGVYLNRKRTEAEVPLLSLSHTMGSKSIVESWVKGVRPTDRNLERLATAFVRERASAEWSELYSELKRLYWTSDVVNLLAEFIGEEAAADIAARLRQYATRLHRLLHDVADRETEVDELVELATLGTRSRLSEPLLLALATIETDDEWREHLQAGGSDWIRRVIGVNLDIDLAEVDALIDETDGGILERWDISNPEAYSHYRRSMKLQAQGKIHEAIAEVARAAELDPLDPANHYTLGSAKGHLGAEAGDKALVEEAIQSCWMAVTLDPNWIPPWTEIGWLMLRLGSAEQAVKHLKSVRPDCGPLDSRYYDALGAAYSALGEHSDALAAYESSLGLNPEEPRIAAVAAAEALELGDKIKFNQYQKMARHHGLSDRWDALLRLFREVQTGSLASDVTEEQEIATLNAAIARNLDDAKAYFARAKVHFMREDDAKAISDLDTVIRFEPGNVNAYMCRGISYAYMGRFDRVIADMSEVIRRRSSDVGAYYWRGSAYVEQKDYDRAIGDFSEVIRLDPNHLDALRAKGDCHRYKQEYDLAIADYDAALEREPDDSLVIRSRGLTYRLKGELDLALQNYDAALGLDSEDSLTYQFRGDVYLATGDYDRAIADFDKALGIGGGDGDTYRKRGNTRLLRRELDLALDDFNAAIECEPADALAYYCGGLVRGLMRDAKGAGKDHRRARELGFVDKA